MIRIRGTNGNDIITATRPDSYTIEGLDGMDQLTGGSFDDTLDGGAGEDTLVGGDGHDVLIGGVGADRLSGGLGVDTASYEMSSAGVVVSLAARRGWGGDAQGDTLIGIENLVGSAHSDKLTGDAGANRLSGGGGTDSLFGEDGDDTLDGGTGADGLDGGSGSDTASYFDSRDAISVNLATNTALGGDAQGDKFKSIENVTGGWGDDTIVGDGNANTLNGGWGDDVLSGGDGADTLIGLFGSDTLEGGAGADTISGVQGTDTASYSSSNAAVTVNIETGAASGGHAQGDVLSSIENLIGSAFADTLTGDSNDNVLTGGAGSDILSGRDGGDTLEGGAGGDRLDGGLGSDTATYASSGAGVVIDLMTGSVGGGHATGDQLISIENLVGSAFHDVLTGSNGNNVIQGGDGDDWIRAGAGVDEVWGGAGNDTFVINALDQQNSIIPWNIEGIGDFVAGGTDDTIDLVNAGTGYTSLADILANATLVTNANGDFGTMIDLGPSGSVLLAGVQMTDLTVSDFIFV